MAVSASTVCAVTSADGGSVTSPKSQNGILPTSREVLSASNAPQPPSLDCMPVSHSVARALAPAMPAAGDPTRRSASTTSAVSSTSG